MTSDKNRRTRCPRLFDEWWWRRRHRLTCGVVGLAARGVVAAEAERMAEAAEDEGDAAAAVAGDSGAVAVAGDDGDPSRKGPSRRRTTVTATRVQLTRTQSRHVENGHGPLESAPVDYSEESRGRGDIRVKKLQKKKKFTRKTLAPQHFGR